MQLVEVSSRRMTQGPPNPYEQPGPFTPPPNPLYPGGSGGGVSPRDKVSTPATLLMVSAIVSLLFNIGNIGLQLLGIGFQAASHHGHHSGMEALFTGSISIVFASMAVLIQGVILYGSFQMQQLKGYTLSMVAAVMAVLPCSSLCCLFSMPVGIWAIIVLNDREVSEAFKQNG